MRRGVVVCMAQAACAAMSSCPHYHSTPRGAILLLLLLLGTETQ